MYLIECQVIWSQVNVIKIKMNVYIFTILFLDTFIIFVTK